MSEWASSNNMSVNTKKCTETKFKFNKLTDSGSTLKIGEELLTRAKEVNLLGTVISDDLKWFANTEKLISVWKKVLYANQIKIFRCIPRRPPSHMDDFPSTSL